MSPTPTRAPASASDAVVIRDAIAGRVVQDVCDLPDRTSPDDWPEALIVTGKELHGIVAEAVGAYLPSAALAPVGVPESVRRLSEAYAAACDASERAVAAHRKIWQDFGEGGVATSEIAVAEQAVAAAKQECHRIRTRLAEHCREIATPSGRADTPLGSGGAVKRAPLVYEVDHDGAWTWLVWAISPAGAHLAAIAHSEAKAEGYRDATARLYPGARVHVERAPVDHTFGASDLRSVAYRAAMKDARRQGLPGFAAAPAAPEPAAGGGREIVRHKVRGTEYEVLGEAEAQITERWGNHENPIAGTGQCWRRLHEEDQLVVYRSLADGKLECCFTDEFRDGRFETVTEARSILSAPTEAETAGGDDASLDDRLRAAGMFTVAEMMGETPMTRWETHVGMIDLAAFGAWLDRKAAEYLRMASAHALGDKNKDDDLYEWVTAHSAAFRAIRTNFKAATRLPEPTSADAGAEGGQA